MNPTDLNTERKSLPAGHKPWPKRDMAEDWADLIALLGKMYAAPKRET